MFVLATIYRPPGQHTDFIKESTDFLSELVLAADKVLIVGDFNIRVHNCYDPPMTHTRLGFLGGEHM